MADGGAERAVQVCPAPPVRTGFETSFDPAWTVTDPSAFRFDPDRPLGGTQSLRIAYRQKQSYFTIPLPSVCAVRVAFSFRADARFLSTGGTIARVSVESDLSFHLQLSGSGVMLVQVNPGIGFPGGSGEILADTAMSVAVTVDVRTRMTSTSTKPTTAPSR